MDYSTIFNKMTKDTFDKFVEINSIDLTKGNTKEEYKKKLEKYFEENPQTEFKFQDFYKRLEEAGRKHFYLYKLHDGVITYKELLEFLKDYSDEKKRTFDPIKDNNKIYKNINDTLVTIKKFQIRESYSLIENNIETKNDEEFLTKRYKITKVHYVIFATFDFKNKRIICGYDSCGDLADKRKDDKELLAFLTKIVGKDVKYESLLTSEHIDFLKHLPNCLAYSISNKANNYDYAKFKKSKANFEDIKKDLIQGKYKINQIKEMNPDFDLQTNLLYTAGLTSAIENDFSLKNDSFEFYYFTDITGKVYYFRMLFDVVESSIITFSESITKEELQDVFKQII